LYRFRGIQLKCVLVALLPTESAVSAHAQSPQQQQLRGGYLVTNPPYLATRQWLFRSDIGCAMQSIRILAIMAEVEACRAQLRTADRRWLADMLL